MLNDVGVNSFQKVYIASGYTDLRYGIDGLAQTVKERFVLDLFPKDVLFLLCGKRTDQIKRLLREGDGFLLLYKRLESGRFQWPRGTQEVFQLSAQQFRWLMEGLCIH